MTLKLEINGTDFTAKWRPYESHWTRRAYLGEASGESEFVIDDDDGTINHADLATYKILRVTEDASGAEFCMFEGRITTKRLGRGPLRTGVAMRWVITAADSNYELRGIRITDSSRPIESDRERILAMRAAYLDGVSSTNPHARDTTDIDGTFVEAADLIDLPAEVYTDTFPDEVFRRIAELAAKTFFVFIDGDAIKHLYYAAFDDDQLEADIEITDDGTDDGVDVYAPELSDSTGLHDGLQVVTGGSVRYAGDQFYEASDVAGGEADHDKWEEHWSDDFLNTVNDATRFITNVVASRSNEDFTFTVSWTMRAEHAHRMQAGYMTDIRLASANVPSPITQRASQVSHTPLYPDADGEAMYRITADFGLPRGRPFPRHIRTKPGPFPPAPPVPDACTRLYFSATASTAGFNPSASAVWDTDSTSGSFENNQLNTAADTTYTGGGSGVTSSAGGSSNDIRLMEHVYELGAATAAILAAGGGTVRAQLKARSRYGVGISEAAQDNISQLVIRIYDSGGTPRGFAYAGHALSSSAGSTKWVAQSLHRNATFPPAAADNELDAVAGTIAGDFMVVEVGYRSFTVGTTGGAILPMSNSGFDLPEDDLTTSNYNSWIEICSGGSGGSTTEPGVNPGEESPGTSNTYAPLDHTHAHGFLDPDGVHMHAEFQVTQEHTNSGSDPTTSDDADAGYSRGWTWNNTTSGDVFFLRDSTAGAADWLLIAPETAGGGPLDNFAASAAPTATDDSGDGYSVGSHWIDTTNDRAYICADASVGAAVWLEGFSVAGDWATISGGTETTVSGYKYCAFTSGGTLTVSAGGHVEAIVVGGGGGGGGYFSGGGGGAGDVVYLESMFLAATTYTIAVGAGGAAATVTTSGGADYDKFGKVGGPSKLGSRLFAAGGGGGHTDQSVNIGSAAAGSALLGGASSGGGGGRQTTPGGTVIGGGNAGGAARTGNTGGTGAGGGGGGAGAAGSTPGASDTGAAGGNGVTVSAFSAFGASGVFGGGGGGGGVSAGGAGGTGGGGHGGGTSANTGQTAATANTGGGGGGGGNTGTTGATGSAGGSGVVVVRAAV